MIVVISYKEKSSGVLGKPELFINKA